MSSHFNNPFEAAAQNPNAAGDPVQVYKLDKPIEAFPLADMSNVPELVHVPEPPVTHQAFEAVKTELSSVKAELAKHKPVVTFLNRDTNCKRIILIAPVNIDGVEVEQVTVWRPTAAMIEEWFSGNNAIFSDLFERMASLPLGSIPQLFADDAAALIEAGQSFLPQFLQTETLSAAI